MAARTTPPVPAWVDADQAAWRSGLAACGADLVARLRAHLPKVAADVVAVDGAVRLAGLPAAARVELPHPAEPA